MKEAANVLERPGSRLIEEDLPAAARFQPDRISG